MASPERVDVEGDSEQDSEPLQGILISISPAFSPRSMQE